MAHGEAAAGLLIRDDAAAAKECESVPSRVAHAELVAKVRRAEWEAVAVVVAAQYAPHTLLALSALEVALALVQTWATMVGVPQVWLLTHGAHLGHHPAHAGSWGLARSARAEASVTVVCIDAPVHLACARSLLAEPEVALRDRACAPRLEMAPISFDGLVRLHVTSRGAISNLLLEPQPALPLLSDSEVVLQVRAVGLNFRDVLNVLGKYPGDPGPPGGDVAGIADDAPSSLSAAFGVGHAPLACMAVSRALFLADKPVALAFEQACTLPVTWSTTHVAVGRAGLHARRSMIVHAAAGGVGLKAVEYAQWLCVLTTIGTAGRPSKHFLLRTSGIDTVCSSRDGGAFTLGAARLLGTHRSHAVLNSLSLDFIAASFMLLGEGGAFEAVSYTHLTLPTTD